MLARLATRFEQAVTCVREGAAVLPGQGLAKGRVGGDVAQTGRFVVRAEGVKTSDRETGAANREVAAKGPIPGKRHQVVVHDADPRSTGSITERVPRRAPAR
jgi:hypothetical protein